MLIVAAVFLMTVVISLVLTKVVRTAAVRLGFTDKPDNDRKLHKGATALGGGVVLYLATTFALAVLLLTPNPWQPALVGAWVELLAFLLAGGRITELGAAARDPVFSPAALPRRTDHRLQGSVRHVDHYGNLVTDLPVHLGEGLLAPGSYVVRVRVEGTTPILDVQPSDGPGAVRSPGDSAVTAMQFPGARSARRGAEPVIRIETLRLDTDTLSFVDRSTPQMSITEIRMQPATTSELVVILGRWSWRVPIRAR